MTIKLYGGHKSWTRDVRARWILKEAGIDYDFVELDLFKGEQRQPEYLAVNPLGKVPYLEDGQVQIFESGAILAYLAERHAPELVPPPGSVERAEYLQWLFYTAATVEAPIVKVFGARYVFPGKEGAEERALQGENELGVHFRLLSERLKRRTFLLGDRFTAADVMVGTALLWAELGGALGPYPVLREYLARLQARPGYPGHN
jgi:glutathione S-transferase